MDVLARLRAAGCRAPIVIMTASAERGVRERALAAGADGFIAKPFAVGDLVMTIDLTVARAARLTAVEGMPAPAGEFATAPPHRAAA
jgi:CheY-like chemotaxis protein